MFHVFIAEILYTFSYSNAEQDARGWNQQMKTEYCNVWMELFAIQTLIGDKEAGDVVVAMEVEQNVQRMFQ